MPGSAFRRNVTRGKELRHALHGKKSEKLTEDERQLAFEDLTIAIEECEAASEDSRATPAASRKTRAPVNRNLGNLPEDLPRIEEVIEPGSLECPCGCGQMHRIGEDRTERLDSEPLSPPLVRATMANGTLLADRRRTAHRGHARPRDRGEVRGSLSSLQAGADSGPIRHPS
ncbi:MAG: hypothetical protein AB8B85_18705 [Paracoccaceae bacterium]